MRIPFPRWLTPALLMLGCSPPGTPVPEDQVVDRFLDALCGRADECACDSFSGWITTEEECREQIGARFERTLDSTVHGYEYDADCAGRWVEALETLDCAAFSELSTEAAIWEHVGCKVYVIEPSGNYEPPPGYEGPPGCDFGQSWLGDTCPEDQYCNRESASDQGADVCLPFERGAAGDPCIPGIWQAFEQCRDGLRCIDGVCAIGPGVGEACTWDDCAQGLHCDRDSDTCIVGSGAGESCGADLPCGAGLYCTLDGTCDALPREGEACHLDQNGVACAEGFDCGADLRCWNARPTICEVMEVY